ncbi:MAG: DUF5663 domain-containing protein [Candidatus Falkowbacteria bacterium]|nr:DUF5663 domain-containing protein [Candidatus Falkowbacteria bacterium]
MLANKSLDDFIIELLKEKDLSILAPEVVEQLKSDLQTRLEDRINAAILGNIPEDKLDEFEQLLDAPDEDKMQEFLNSVVPDLEAVVALELFNFRKLYLA